MSELVLADVVIDHLRKRYPCYHETAYLFILSGLHYTIERLGETRHITGRELTEGCRDLAIERYGPMARSVLEFWGIRSTRDLGSLVFALVECGVLVKQETDDLDDFDGVYDFSHAFERDYPWAAPRELRG
ncbi:MAG TPA: Minf_1886 family protein [Longimicrobiaceae bacterium]|nr:Minf_1886 family protein [Longimicrobiaceae bacterium]